MDRALRKVAAMIDSQLSEIPDQFNFLAEVRQARAAIHAALATGDLRAERAAVAAYGGVVKRWRRWLIETITDTVLAGVPGSRGAVRAWQQAVFGRAVASGRLSRYATPQNSGGGRVASIEPTEAQVLAIRAFYTQHRERVKSVQ